MSFISRKYYLSKHNSYDIPGFTQEKVDDMLNRHKNEEYPLYQVEKCPICGKNYLGHYTICGWCGYEAECDEIDEYKKLYIEKIKNDPDFIWELDI